MEVKKRILRLCISGFVCIMLSSCTMETDKSSDNKRENSAGGVEGFMLNETERTLHQPAVEKEAEETEEPQGKKEEENQTSEPAVKKEAEETEESQGKKEEENQTSEPAVEKEAEENEKSDGGKETAGKIETLTEQGEGAEQVSQEKDDIHLHEFEKSVWEVPTCKQGGYYNNICKICGLEECVTLDKLPHEVEDIEIQEGNCMEDTIVRHICKNCGEQVESDTRYTVYDRHDWVQEEIDGLSIEYCQRCGVAR